MMQVKKIDRKQGCKYILNEAGDILEVSTIVNCIGSIAKREGYSYSLMADGSIIERELVVLKPEQFYAWKQSGKLAQLYREGKDVKLDESEATLGVLHDFMQEDFKSQLNGTTIVDVLLEPDEDGRALKIVLSNGKQLILREGLLAKGTVIELK